MGIRNIRYLVSSIHWENQISSKVFIYYLLLFRQSHDMSSTFDHKIKAEVKILFKARTNMLSVKWNFGDKSLSPLCKLNDDKQDHLLSCIPSKFKFTQVHQLVNWIVVRRCCKMYRQCIGLIVQLSFIICMFWLDTIDR